MTQIEHLREQAQRAERLARNVLDAVTVARLLEASEDYRQQADYLERRVGQPLTPSVALSSHSSGKIEFTPT